LLFLAKWAGNPLFHVPMGDELNFHDTALSLLGLRAPAEAFLFQPLYAYFLAGIYETFGVDVGTVRTVQLLIGVLSCLLFYGLGYEIGGRWTGRLSALLLALYGPMVFFEGTLLAPALVVPLMAGALWSLLAAGKRNSYWLVVPAGILVGIAMLGRPNLGIMVPVAAIWLLRRPWPVKSRLLALGLAGIALVVGLSPAWIHNVRTSGQIIPVSSSGGINFFIGNNPQATGRFHIPKGERFTGSTHWDFKENTKAIAENAEGRKLSASEVSAYWMRRGFDFWAQEPLQALKLTGKKLLLALNGVEIPVHHPYVFAKEVVPILAWLLSFSVVFPFSVLGAWLGIRRLVGVDLLVGCAVAYLLTLLIFFVADRFRAAMLPVLLPLAAAGMLLLTERIRQWRHRFAWPQLIVLALAFAITKIPMVSDTFEVRSIARGYNRMGKAEGDRGNLEAAEHHFRKALELSGPRDGLALLNLGKLYSLHGELRKARKIYQYVAQEDAENRAVRIMLARLSEREGKIAEAIRWWKDAAALMADQERALREIFRLRLLLMAQESQSP